MKMMMYDCYEASRIDMMQRYQYLLVEMVDHEITVIL
jgi:hypothetical protein